jgi:hypothetical protein
MTNGFSSELLEHLNLPGIFSGDLSAFEGLFFLILMIAIYSIVIYHFYRYIARRDCFKPSKFKHTKAVGVLKYLFLYPFVAMLFFMGFSVMMIFLTKTYEITRILEIAFAIIVAIRITAYWTEDLSKDVAKMLPFAMLGIFLVDPGYFTFDLAKARIEALPPHVNEIIQFLILIILVEWILRLILAIRYAIKPKKEEVVAEEA